MNTAAHHCTCRSQ